MLSLTLFDHSSAKEIVFEGVNSPCRANYALESSSLVVTKVKNNS